MSEIGAESPLTTSVWHRPLIPEEAKDRLAKRQTNAAVALLQLGREDKVWPLLKHRPDLNGFSLLKHAQTRLLLQQDRCSWLDHWEVGQVVVPVVLWVVESCLGQRV